MLDIYATRIDLDPSVEASQRFFAAVQNKMHWAAHGKTAASNRGPDEWLATFADPVRAQAASGDMDGRREVTSPHQ